MTVSITGQPSWWPITGYKVDFGNATVQQSQTSKSFTYTYPGDGPVTITASAVGGRRVAVRQNALSGTIDGRPGMTTEADVLAIVKAIVDQTDIDDAVRRVHALEGEPRVRAWLASMLIPLIMRSGTSSTVAEYVDRTAVLSGLSTVADADGVSNAQRGLLRAGTRVMEVISAMVEGRLVDPVQALADLERASAGAPDDPGLRVLTELARQLATLERDLQSGDEGAYRRAGQELQRLREQAAAVSPDLLPHLEGLDMFCDVMANGHTSEEQLLTLIPQYERLADALPADSPTRQAFEDARAMVASMAPHVIPGQVVPGLEKADSSADAMARLAARAAQPGVTPAQRARFLVAAGGTALDGFQATDVDQINRGLECHREAAALLPRGSTGWFQAVTGAALALWRRNELTNNHADLGAAEELLLAARDAAGDPQHRSWNLVNTMLSEIQRALGKDGNDAALATSRGVAWRVLLQDDAAAARRVAREALEDAVPAAQRSLLDGDPATAIQILDSARALMLFAATEFGDVPNRLRTAGRPDLAERWLAAEPDGGRDRLPTSLRHEVLSVFARGSGLLDPPSPAEIRLALRALDADALVYLLPGTGIVPGFAVMAAARAGVSYIPLAGLTVDGEADVNRYLGALRARDAHPVEAEPAAGLSGSLDAVSDWAWRAAIGPLIEQYLPTLPAPAADRPHRLVLVPMGELALIPWQAARRRDGVPALRLAAFSQAASARMLCRSAQATPVPLSPVGLVVGDPDTGVERQRLAGARVEAFAVHQSFYRAGKYVGRRADGSPSPAGAGSAQQVRDWLADPRPAAGAMLHLACHGAVETDGPAPASYLLLAAGGRLTAEEIVALLLDTPERRIALAVLAACHTGRSAHGYDEAYSLGTAFLAGGVRSVLSAQWAVPDEATSVLMYMFHHYLVGGRLPTWEALRRAQLWMLDPDREIPATMPAALRHRLAGADLSRTEAWAGFIHLGR